MLSGEEARVGKLAQINAAGRRAGGAGPASIPFERREAIADAIAGAVTTVVGVDAAPFACALFTMAGVVLLREATGRDDFYPQAGSLFLQPDPADPGLWFSMDAEAKDGGVPSGEMHAWLADAATGELIDLASRHYPALIVGTSLVPGSDEVPRAWRRGRAPAFLLGTPGAWPDWVRLSVSPAATKYLLHRTLTTPRGVSQVKEVFARAQLLLRGGVLIPPSAEGIARDGT